MDTDLKYIFIGGTYRGYKLFISLIESGTLPEYSYILQEDKHEEQKYSKLISNLCESNNISFRICKKLSDSDYEFIKSEIWDFGLICGWRTIIDYKVNSCFKSGLIAAHDSLLPKYRGFAPLNWAMINGEHNTGVTLFQINNGDIDSGPIINQFEVEIKKDDYAIDVYEKITSATILAINKFIQNYKNQSWSLTPQNETLASYTCKRTPDDGKIQWTQSSTEIINLIRALAHPYPGAYCVYENKIFHIRKAVVGIQNNKRFVGRIPGRILTVSEEGVEVLCGKGSILILEWEDKNNNVIQNPSNIVKKITNSLV